MLENTAIVLQGYSVSKEQMEEVVRSYIDQGIKNIVVSSYSKCISDFVRKNAAVIEHDKVNGKFKNTPVDQFKIKTPDIQGGFTEGFKIRGRGNGQHVTVNADVKIPSSVETKLGNVNYQIYTSKEGLLLAKKEFGAEYALKCRADILIYNLVEKLTNWIKMVNTNPPRDNVFDSRILAPAYSGSGWAVVDYLAFGKTDDLVNYYSIPFYTPKQDPKRKFHIAEQYISSSRILSIAKEEFKTSFDTLGKKYFCFDPDIDAYWYKPKAYLKDMPIFKKVLSLVQK